MDTGAGSTLTLQWAPTVQPDEMNTVSICFCSSTSKFFSQDVNRDTDVFASLSTDMKAATCFSR